MRDDLRIGVIGVGAMGTAHARHLADGFASGANLTALCDVSEARREHLAAEFPGVPIFDDPEALFAAAVCDAVIIATPHYDHPEIGIRAFANGLHVLTEKPVAVQCGRAKALIRAAEESGKAFAVMFNQRTEPIFRTAREIVRSGELGQPKRLDWIITNWYRTQRYYDSGSWRATWSGEGGGVLMNQAPHNLDLWQWIFGMPRTIRAICRVGRYHDIEVEDDAILLGEYENGATALFRTSTGEYPGTNRLEITGDRGKLVLERGVLKRWTLETPEREVCFTSDAAFARIPFSYLETEPEKQENPHGAVLQNFADHIRKGTPLIAPGGEALGALEIANGAYLSAWTGKTVELPVDDELFDRLLAERRQGSRPRGSGAATHGGGYRDRWQVNW